MLMLMRPCVAVSQLGPGSGLPDAAPQRRPAGARHGAGPLGQRGRSAPRESDPAEGRPEGADIPAVSWCVCLLWE